MRDRRVWLAVVLMTGLAAVSPGQAQQVTNLFQNPGFETGVLAPWGSYGSAVASVTSTVVTDCVGADVPEGPIEGKYCLNVKVSGAGTNYWDGAVSPVLIAGQGTFKQGKKYTLSLFLKSKSGTAQLNLKPQLAQSPWTGYGSQQVTASDKWTEYHITTPVMAADVTPASITFHILFKAQEFWIDDVKWYEGDYVPTVVKNKFGAQSPTPDNKAVDVRFDPMLSWKAGPFAATHNVYFGTAFEDVNAAPLAQAAAKSQTETAYEPPPPLEYGKTYYWRVDEVNAPPDAAVFKGDVWSFTVEPYTYPITSVTATASSSDKTTTGPTNTVNGSGLANDLHSTASDAMWLSSMTGTQPTWIRYAFDKVYKLDELWVWNYNMEFESVLGYGFKDVTVEYSTDGTTWTVLKDVEFAQATTTADYAHNTVVSLDGVMARYVRLTANSNWSAVGLKQYGLSEVRFFYLPVEARAPQPANYAENISVDVALDWRPGRESVSHVVSYGTDKTAVADGTAMTETVPNHGADVGPFDFGMIYYWKVDEVGEITYPGGVWSFTTQEFAVIDDFDSYTDDEGSRIYESWIDGWTNDTGSTVGHLQAPFAEKSIVHSGRQSMPFAYDNAAQPYYSEAERTFDTPIDWTISGANTLTLFVRGVADNGAAALYLTIEDRTGKKATVTHPDPAVTTTAAWTEWRIPFSDVTGVNLAAVKKLTFGAGNRAAPKAGGAGTLYIDDILFGKPILPIGLVAHYTFENSVDDISGNGHHGALLGTPTYVDGPAGQGKAMLFPGTAGNAVNLGTFNPSERTGMLSVALWAKWSGLSNYWQGLIGKRDNWNTTDTMWQIEANQTTGALSFSRNGSYPGSGNPVLTVGEWTHIAVTFDKTTARFYVNGNQTGSGAFTFGPAREAALQIGADNAGGGNPFNGALDDVRLYDRVLTPAEILTLAGK